LSLILPYLPVAYSVTYTDVFSSLHLRAPLLYAQPLPLLTAPRHRSASRSFCSSSLRGSWPSPPSPWPRAPACPPQQPHTPRHQPPGAPCRPDRPAGAGDAPQRVHLGVVLRGRAALPLLRALALLERLVSDLRLPGGGGGLVNPSAPRPRESRGGVRGAGTPHALSPARSPCRGPLPAARVPRALRTPATDLVFLGAFDRSFVRLERLPARLRLLPLLKVVELRVRQPAGAGGRHSAASHDLLERARCLLLGRSLSVQETRPGTTAKGGAKRRGVEVFDEGRPVLLALPLGKTSVVHVLVLYKGGRRRECAGQDPLGRENPALPRKKRDM
jgi:hypothetical protein